MTDTKKENQIEETKVTFLNAEGLTALLSTKLDGIKISSSCKVTGGKKGAQIGAIVKGDFVEDVKTIFNFNGTTLMEALKKASGGSSFMVSAQTEMRKLTKAELEKAVKVPLTFHMSDIFNKKKGGFTANPVAQANRAVAKMSTDQRAALKAKLEEMEKAEIAEKAAK